jgi:nucleotide-binding universal stress UspA family protein
LSLIVRRHGIHWKNKMFEKILVPLDGSNQAERVIPYAGELAAKLGSEALLVSVVDPVHTDEEHLRRSYLEQVSIRMRDRCRAYGLQECRVETRILPGKPADEILKFAEESDAGLIAVTNRGSTDNASRSLGGITAKIIRSATRPVLLVRTAATEAARSRKNLIERILVPLDGSKTGEAAIPYVTALAKAAGAEVVLFQAVEHVRQVTGYFTILPESIQATEEGLQAEAVAYLKRAEEVFMAQQIKTSVVVVWGAGAEQIIDYSEANNIDLIAMSSHGESGISRWVFGSVTDKVIHAGNTPLLVVRAAGE